MSDEFDLVAHMHACMPNMLLLLRCRGPCILPPRAIYGGATPNARPEEPADETREEDEQPGPGAGHGRPHLPCRPLWWRQPFDVSVVTSAALDDRDVLELYEVDVREVPAGKSASASAARTTGHAPGMGGADAAATAADMRRALPSIDDDAIDDGDGGSKDVSTGPPGVAGCRVQLVAHNVSKHRLMLCVATSPAALPTDFVAA